MRRVFHGVQVIEVAEELVEAVDGGQKLIEITEVVLAELASGVALRFERSSNRASLSWQPGFSARLPDRGHAGATGQFAGNEVRPARGATRLGVVVSEQHPLLGELVEVRRLAGHQATMVGADVPHADVIAHDDDDVGFLVLRKNVARGERCNHCNRDSEYRTKRRLSRIHRILTLCALPERDMRLKS